MIKGAADRCIRGLTRWVDGARRHAWLVLAATIALTVLAGYVAATQLGVNTSTDDMISPEVPFRRNDDAFRQAFPQFGDIIAVVIEGSGPAVPASRLDDATARLEAALAAQPGLFTSIYRPGGEAYFRQEGLLFLDLPVLQALSDRLAAAQPLLGALGQDPSLRGLSGVLTLAVDQFARGTAAPPEIIRTLDDIAEVVEAQSAGRELTLAWRDMVAGSALALAGGRRFLLVRPVLDHTTMAPAATALAAIRRIAAELGIGPEQGLRLRLTGSPALETEELDSVSGSASLASILSFVLVAVLIVLGLRDLRLIFGVLATLVIGLVWTAGFAAVAVGSLNLLSVAFAVLFLGIAVDFGIHFALRYRESRQRGRDHAEALRRSMPFVGRAMTLAALCVSIGFLAFLPTDYLGLVELGVISAGGMLVALFAYFTVLPALITLVRPNIPAIEEPPPDLPYSAGDPLAGTAAAASAPSSWDSDAPIADNTGRARLLERLATRHRRVVLTVTAALAVLSVAAVPFARFDVNPLSLQNPEAEAVATFLDLARAPQTTPYTIDVLMPNIEAARELVPRLEALPLTGRVLTLASFVPAGQDAKLEIVDAMALAMTPVLTGPAEPDPPDAAACQAALDGLEASLAALTSAAAGAGASPDAGLATAATRLRTALAAFRAQFHGDAAALAELEQRLVGSLPGLFDELRTALSAQPVILGDVPDSLRERWISADGRARIEVAPAVDVSDTRTMEAFARSVLAIAPNATGTPVIVTEASHAVVQAFTLATALTVGLIMVVLFVVLGRPGDVGVTLAPLVLAALLTLATTVLCGLTFNFANVIALPLMFGLGVSSSVHMVMRHRLDGARVALMRTSTPRAVMFSALTNLASFGSLAVSPHRGMSSMGLLLSIAISFILLCALVVLPSLIEAKRAWLARRG